MTIKVETTNASKAGDKTSWQKVYVLYLMGQNGAHYKSRGVVTIRVTVIDDCWASQIKLQQSMVAQSQLLQYYINYRIPKVYDTVSLNTTTTAITSGQAYPTGYNCGAYKYSLTCQNATCYNMFTFNENYSPTHYLFQGRGTKNE